MDNMGKKVLILDDQRFSRIKVISLLKKKGFREFIESSSVEDALDKYKREKPYFVLLDVILPGKSGKEFLREILELDPEARVFVMSVLSREEDMKDCLELGASGYLTKPLTEDKLEHIMYTLKHLDG